MHTRTQAVHAGRAPDRSTGAIAEPIHLSTTFERDPDGSYPRQFSYSTFDNPNRAALETAMALLEGGAAAVATGSGMAAIASVISGLASGDRILVSHDLFQGTARLLNDQVRGWGVDVDIVDICDLAEVAAAITSRTRMIWVDTPSNPLLRIASIEGLAALAKSSGAHLVVDTTFATFALQRPLDLGADVAIYAATKYVGGHSDVVNGMAVFREAGHLYERARAFQINVGAVPSPFDCWLVQRGLRTLPLRVHAQSKSALAVAEALATHPRVQQVYYPGLPSSPDYETAVQQMKNGYGGMVAASILGGRPAALAAVAGVRLFTRAASFGGVESLIEHRASSPTQVRGQGTGFAMPENLLRLSIGLEAAEDLIADLYMALDGCEP